MVSEFVQTYQLTIQIKSLIQEHLNSTQILYTVYPSLIQTLGQLIGCFPHQERSSLCRWTKGSLTKLKEYCEQFSRNSLHQNKQHVHLHMATHQTWLTAMHNLELLNAIDINSFNENSDINSFLQTLKRAFNTLIIRFNQVIRTIPRVLNSFWNNENVMLCLLRKRTEFIEIYGSDFLYKRFKWPVKTKELVQLILQRYRERGFEALMPTIQQMIDSTEALDDVR
jgi:hypothetical protein